MAPTINTTKLVATAIATLVSTDKFITLPSFMAAISMAALLKFPFCHRFEIRRADGCQDRKLEGRTNNDEIRHKKKNQQ
jgi:hypothetical protein